MKWRHNDSLTGHSAASSRLLLKALEDALGCPQGLLHPSWLVLLVFLLLTFPPLAPFLHIFSLVFILSLCLLLPSLPFLHPWKPEAV